jgi:hypothetical protein
MSTNRVTKRSQDGNAARQSSRYTSVDIVPASVTVEDTEYHAQVEKLQALHGTRGSYLLGSGALDKNDALFMMEEEERRSRTVALRASEERRAFAEQLERLRREECDDGGDEERLLEEKRAKGKGLKRGVVQGLKGRKRKGLAVESVIAEDRHEIKEINTPREEKILDDDSHADDVNALQLLGCYSKDGSDSEEDGPDQVAHEQSTKRKPLPSALDLL